MGRRIVETEAQSVMWRVMRAKSFTVEEERSGTDNSVTVSLSKDHMVKAWQPTPVTLPGKSHGQRSQADYSPRGCTELDTTKILRAHTHTP